MKTCSLRFVSLLAIVCALAVIPARSSDDDGRGRSSGSDDRNELKGRIESLPPSGFVGQWKVSGVTLHVTSNTQIDQEHGQAAIGAFVEAKGSRRPDGSFDAARIEVQSGDQGDGQLHFKGTIETLPAGTFLGDWSVGGRTVRVTRKTRIETEIGPVVVGAFVEVEGAMRQDGVFAASKIEVKSNPAGGDGRDELKGIIDSLPSSGLVGDWVVSGRTVRVSSSTIINQEHGAVAVGVAVEIHGALQSDGSIDARRIEVKRLSEDTGRAVNMKGSVEDLPSPGLIGDWTVSGKVVHVSESTRIKQQHGQVAIGVRVKVKGRRLSDGSINATMIQVRDSQ
jgi:hypothetical protein